MNATAPTEGTPVRVFIGSSGEGIDVANYLHLVLEERANCEVTIWNQGVFEPSGYALDSLLDVAAKSDFAVLIATPDDQATHRGQQSSIPRDNVMLELGLFLGTLGRARTFLLPTTRDIRLPSDVFGLTTLPYRHRTDGNMRAAVASATTAVAERITALGHRTPAAAQPENAKADSTTSPDPTLKERPFRTGDGVIANRVAMGDNISAAAANAGIARTSAFSSVERLKKVLGVTSLPELTQLLRARGFGFGAAENNPRALDHLLLSCVPAGGGEETYPADPERPRGADDASALAMEIEQLCTNARAQGWTVKTNNETTLKIVPPGAGRQAHVLRKSTPRRTRVRLRTFARELAADGLRVNGAVAGPVEESPF